ncbi:MAG: flagellar biosynthetic protein FliR [Candidatus Delongbacteria bacterium]|nr:flagellar biosynthetic protein FliR [Candidatus Delongbacteria bacterium]
MDTFNLLEFSVNEIKAFTLVFIRISGLVLASPVLGSNLVLSRLKIGLAFILAVIIFPALDYQASLLPNHLLSYLSIVTRELFLGLTLGFLFHVLFIGIQFAGDIIGMQMGFSIVNVLDPQSSLQLSIIGEIKYLTAMLLFLVMNGHYMIVEALFSCFQIVPVAMVNIQPQLQLKLVEMTGWVFIYLFKIGAPVLIALYITEIAMGIIARTVPQMNIFIVGFPLKIGLGLLTLGLALPVWSHVFQKLVETFSVQWQALLLGFK